MAERSFAKEVESLRLGSGQEFRGEGILAVTKALLQSGVAYVGGYQGAPISHLMDVLNDAREILDELGVHFEASTSEATAAAMLAASINYPLRGAVAWKSTVGTNVASDALSNLASAGVKGGALIILGEDYGEGASIMQERTHAFAMKSQIWLLDPKPTLPAITKAVEQAFDLSEVSHTPVMLMLRIRACHVYGHFTASDNRRPVPTASDVLSSPMRDGTRIILPPHTYQHEQEKIRERLPAALNFITTRELNETINPNGADVGIILQGGLYNGVVRSLSLLGAATVFGDPTVPLHVLNVTYPLVPSQLVHFCFDKRAVLVIEEGQPEFIEQALTQILHKHDVNTRVVGKDVLPMAGEYTGDILQKGIRKFLETWAPRLLEGAALPPPRSLPPARNMLPLLPARPPGLCTGCPERPFFAAMKLVQREVGAVHISADIGCHSFGTLPPFNLGASIMGYGLASAGASALSKGGLRRAVSVMGDGGFWHNGLTSGLGNSVFNKHDTVTVVIDNHYSAATGGQDIPSSRTTNSELDGSHSIVDAVAGIGVNWIKRVNLYDMKQTIAALRDALTTSYRGPKVIVAQGECQLNRQRRIIPIFRRSVAAGRPVVRSQFGVDPDVCTGDHSCIRLSGCPSLTIKENPDPLRQDPVAHVDTSCVGCGVCGEVAHAAALCPSFYRADLKHNPTYWDRWMNKCRRTIIGVWQRHNTKQRERVAL